MTNPKPPTIEDELRAVATIEHYKDVCKAEAPYPLNYLPFTENGQMLGAVIGMMIERGMFR